MYANFQRSWGAIEANLACYMGWGGRYFSNIMLTVANPMVYSKQFNEYVGLYHLHCLAEITMYLFGMFVVFRWLLASNFVALILTLVAAATAVGSMRNVAEYLYWMAGAYTYCIGISFGFIAMHYFLVLQKQIEDRQAATWKIGKKAILTSALVLASMFIFRKPVILFLNNLPPVWLLIPLVAFLVVLMVHALITNSKNSKPGQNVVWGIVACAVSMGSSEAMFFVLVPVFLGLAGLCYLESKKLSPFNLAFVLGSIIAGLLNVISPATFARKGSIKQASAKWWSVKELENLYGYLDFMPFLLLFFLFFVWYLLNSKHEKSWPIKQIMKYSFANHFWALYGFYLVFVLPLILTIIANQIPDRTKNAVVAFAVVPMLFLASGLSNYAAKRGIQKFGLGGAIVMLALLVVFHFKGTKAGIQLMISGQAPLFLEQEKQRFQKLEACTTDTCFFQPVGIKPPLIYIGENAIESSDPESWKRYKNMSFAAFYDKETIVVQKP